MSHWRESKKNEKIVTRLTLVTRCENTGLLEDELINFSVDIYVIAWLCK